MTLIQQQRLLGAVLLVCLIGVIAWFLLETVEQNQPAQPKQETITFDSVIEPIPEDVEVVEPVQEALVDSEGRSESEPVIETDAEQVAAVPTQPEAKPAPAPAPAPAPTPAPEPTTSAESVSTVDQTSSNISLKPQWVLQLGSFSVRENADALSAQLKQMGYDPMTETISSAGTLIYRVRLQPVTDRIKLQQTAQTLSEKLKLNAQILQHKP